ncbi:putative leucine-rich repeat-containing, plant-type, leucine-rich repeat domain superfamily [Helianthus anomalus]
MESWLLSKHKSLILILLVFMIEQLQGVCIDDERKALLEIKASLNELSHRFDVSKLLSTWVDHEITHGDCCDWEGIKCDKTTGYIISLSLSNLFSRDDDYLDNGMRWRLNLSPFLRFKELRSLDLSWNFIDHTIVSTDISEFSVSENLEVLDLSHCGYYGTLQIQGNISP